MPATLSFETSFFGRKFLVNYETESPLQNLLTSIIYQELPLDKLTLQYHNAALYTHVKNEILRHAKDHWSVPPKATYESAYTHFYSKFN